ncbi:unnamed protein product [Paramecium octaurelia]|uniref:Uncharacterized protein n=1 Tax=Paramecium octaurelia TaxID=43137 RepID=A0A8S1X2B6_PAROT|nr:unnamed protein product [Paramecium octaurelia]
MWFYSSLKATYCRFCEFFYLYCIIKGINLIEASLQAFPSLVVITSIQN